MEFPNQVIKQEQVDIVEEMIFTEYQTEQDKNSTDEETERPKKKEWLDAPTKLLISLVKELRPQVGKTVKLKTKKKMWQQISEIMVAKGYTYNAQQVEVKYYSLERQYKRNKMHFSLTGRNRQSCVYQTELDDLLQERKCISPEYVLSEENAVSTVDEELTDADTHGTSSKLFNSRSIDKSIKKTAQEKMLEKIDVLTKSTLEFESKSLKLLELQIEMVKRKEERAERDEARKKRKLELLETLVSKLNKN